MKHSWSPVFEPLFISLSSLAWIAALSVASIRWFCMPTSSAWLMAGSLTFLFGISLFYLAWQFNCAMLGKPAYITFSPSNPLDPGCDNAPAYPEW